MSFVVGQNLEDYSGVAALFCVSYLISLVCVDGSFVIVQYIFISQVFQICTFRDIYNLLYAVNIVLCELFYDYTLDDLWYCYCFVHIEHIVRYVIQTTRVEFLNVYNCLFSAFNFISILCLWFTTLRLLWCTISCIDAILAVNLRPTYIHISSIDINWVLYMHIK